MFIFSVFLDEELRKKWVIAVKRKDWAPTKSSKLCSTHFREQDFDRSSLSYLRFREGTIPSIFPAISEVKERRTLKRKLDEPLQCETQVSDVESPNKKKLKLELMKTKTSLSIQKKLKFYCKIKGDSKRKFVLYFLASPTLL